MVRATKMCFFIETSFLHNDAVEKLIKRDNKKAEKKATNPIMSSGIEPLKHIPTTADLSNLN